MNRLVGVYEVVLFRKVEIVEVIYLENRFNFTIFKLFGLLVDIAIGFNDGAVSLTLAKKDEVLFSNGVKGFAVFMTD